MHDLITDRRSGRDRRADAAAAAGQANEHATATVARWPLVVGADFDDHHPPDPWASVVHRAAADYRAGRCDSARQAWDERITWRVDGGAPVVGADGVFAHHRQLLTLTDGTFHQTLVAIEPSGGPIVEAHVRTTATRNGRTLDIPTLIVFELAAMRIRQVTEIPGDQAAWDAFWAD
ncbi:MAG: hypothetical protein QOF49_825 [Chloroflexota bacterium]|jgi:hypothetical protein|nr:hypothetical protein [Chloroflexota bacterium]